MAPRLSPAEALERALAERRILVSCGSGGVGKTTTAAALAVRAALSGRRVLVCTIDPSRRLATSLGLNQLSGKPRSIDLSRLAPPAARGGALWAMVLDVKSTFDALVARHTPDAAARERILGNRFYRHVSAALAGSHEYMAMEKLLELSADERFDLVVLDTPPTRHALDFLEAPDRLLDFLDTTVLRWFLRPYFVAGRLTLRVATRTGAAALRLADRFLGLQFLQDLSEFFLAFESMYDGFQERATRVHALLRDPSSGFVMVAGPQPLALEEALYFHRRLTEKRMPFVAFVVNRVHTDPVREVRRRKGVRAAVSPGLADRLARTLREQQVLARVERRAVARLEVDTRERSVLVPELEQDVHDLRGLAEFSDLVFGAARGRTRPVRAAVGR
ncbi:MAG TPA: ArsA-related P-loop ATPase [Vicinamibacteria bacterium]|nr:ArsA-related P-loop ATPase [Vicinamibacteria bacterium]